MPMAFMPKKSSGLALAPAMPKMPAPMFAAPPPSMTGASSSSRRDESPVNDSVPKSAPTSQRGSKEEIDRQTHGNVDKPRSAQKRKRHR